MISAGQLRAARALLGIDQRQLAGLSGLSHPTIQRMEASEGVIRGNVDSLIKLVTALDAAGIELIGEGAMSGRASGERPIAAAIAATPRRRRAQDRRIIVGIIAAAPADRPMISAEEALLPPARPLGARRVRRGRSSRLRR